MHGCVRIDIGLFVLALCLNVSGPYILKKSKDIKAITSSLLPLEYCSTDSRVVGYRTMSINNGKDCPHGTLYLCGKDSTERFIIETCQSVVECPPGNSIKIYSISDQEPAQLQIANIG